MSSSGQGTLHAIILVGMILVAGCSFGAVDQTHSQGGDQPPTPTPRFIEPLELDQNISIVNDDNSSTYYATLLVVEGRLQEATFALTAGEENVTRTYDIENNSGFSIPGTTRLTDVTPVNATEKAEYSTAIRPQSAVSFPLPTDPENVTYLLVRISEQPETGIEIQYHAYRCNPPSEGFRLRYQIHNQSASYSCK